MTGSPTISQPPGGLTAAGGTREGGVMEDKCPFCGSPRTESPYAFAGDFDCGNYLAKEPTGATYWDRPRECFRRENTTLQAQVAGMREVLEKVLVELSHVRIFITSSAKMHRDGIALFDETLSSVQALLSFTPAGEWVVVKREDLQTFLDKWVKDDPEYIEVFEVYDRLRAALGPGWEE